MRCGRHVKETRDVPIKISLCPLVDLRRILILIYNIVSLPDWMPLSNLACGLSHGLGNKDLDATQREIKNQEEIGASLQI